MKSRKLLLKLSKKFPKRIAKNYHDYVGLMCGKVPEEINTILLCLDMDKEVLPEVIKVKPDIIITHHPFIYGKKRYVLKYDEEKRALYEELERLNIPVYSFHTNFDTGKDGMNDALINALELNNIYAPNKEPMMRIGYLSNPMPVEEFLGYAKEKLNVNYGLFIKGEKELISKVGIVGGGGSRDWVVAKDEGCDIYISGDVTHHVRREIHLANFNYLDVPHEVERIFMKQMTKNLLEIDQSLKIYIVDHEELPKVV